VKNIYNIAFIIIFGGVIIPLFQFLVGIFSINKIGIAGLDINFGINLTMILIGLLILILASIFQYGAYLQNENDQTI
jgi:Ca2+/Na+ antiporter